MSSRVPCLRTVQNGSPNPVKIAPVMRISCCVKRPFVETLNAISQREKLYNYILISAALNVLQDPKASADMKGRSTLTVHNGLPRNASCARVRTDR